jgi:hypothetical protein
MFVGEEKIIKFSILKEKIMDELKDKTDTQQEVRSDEAEKKQTNKMLAMLMTPKVIGGIVGTLVVLWLFSVVIGFFQKKPAPAVGMSSGIDVQTGPIRPMTTNSKPESPVMPMQRPVQPEVQPSKSVAGYTPYSIPKTSEENKAAADNLKRTMTAVMGSGQRIKGVAFLTAAIEPIDYELNKRWWGWRSNDLIEPTDNVNKFQLGVLEVTRRTAVHLAQRISRTGNTAVIDPDLEQAMNRLMVKANQWWLPSAESQYQDAINGYKNFIKKLEKGEAAIYTRAENLEPLLQSYADLLGACDQNLVKSMEEDGKSVSWFKVDDYFYYSQGIASAIKTMLIAIREDFSEVLVKMQAMEAMDHAIAWNGRATEIKPLIVLDGGAGSIFANHRANMAAPISHARFYVEVMIKAVTAGRTG